MNLSTINPITDEALIRKSSIYQHSNLLSVLKRGEWCPILFDVIDRIECGKVYTKKVAIRLREGANYTFPVGTTHYTEDVYLLTQQNRIKLKALPSYFGEGFYEVREHKDMLTNIGKFAFGYHKEKTLRVGKDYVQATKTLKAIE